jgi:hypothetical protein
MRQRWAGNLDGGDSPPGHPFLRVYSLVGTRGSRVRSGSGRLGEATLPDLRFVQTGGATNQNAFPPSDGRKAEVRVNQKSILAIGITPLLFDS